MRLNVGDLAVVTSANYFPERVGQIVTIIEPYEERRCRLPDGRIINAFRYVVRHMDGVKGCYSFRNIKPLEGTPVQVETEEAATCS